jgi:hypothetical protein
MNNLQCKPSFTLILTTAAGYRERTVNHALPAAFATDATSRASAKGKEHVFLSPPLVVVLLFDFGDCSRNVSRSGKEERVVKGVGQNRHHRLSQRKEPGAFLKRPVPPVI